jgi:Asp-tRNA(Asn)/Glu-tRNA(Gln) amidotransferase A subunit family amidase
VTAAPIGFSKEGLPIGVQIIGPQYHDRTCIAFAGLLEREFQGSWRPSRTSRYFGFGQKRTIRLLWN